MFSDVVNFYYSWKSYINNQFVKWKFLPWPIQHEIFTMYKRGNVENMSSNVKNVSPNCWSVKKGIYLILNSGLWVKIWVVFNRLFLITRFTARNQLWVNLGLNGHFLEECFVNNIIEINETILPFFIFWRFFISI